MDSYLEIARAVLRNSRQPLSARQILKTALQLQLVPRDLYGRTQHKTLQARLATDILKHRTKSAFYRVGPGRFFLRSFLIDHSIPLRYRQEFHAPLRANQLGRFDVVVFPNESIARLAAKVSAPFGISRLLELPWRFARLNAVRQENRLVPFRFLLLLVADGRIFMDNRRPTAVEGDMHRQSVIGVEGFVKWGDLSLFSHDHFGLWDAAARVLLEQLELPARVRPKLEDHARWSAAQAVINTDDRNRLELMVYVRFECTDINEIREAIDARASSEWMSSPIKVNDLDRFDKWSTRFIEDGALRAALGV